MKVLRGDPLEWETSTGRGSAVSIGVFDGVHRGHQEVLADLTAQAAELGGLDKAVLTFDPHPRAILEPDAPAHLLATVEQRLEWLELAGMDIVGVLPFPAVRDMQPHFFIRRVLTEALSARVVVVGVDFRFGVGRSGNVDTLWSAGQELGFAVDGVPLLSEALSPLSSSRIRHLVKDGEVAAAAELLGRPFTMRGVVVRGDGRGRTIGVPTANMAVAENLVLPARGVYASQVTVSGGVFPAVTNVGIRPTFDGEKVTVESHLLDVEQDMYGMTIDVAFLRRLRDEQRFDGVEALLAQIQADIVAARSAMA